MAVMASEDIAKLAETLAKTQVAGGQLSFKGKSLKLNTAEDGKFLCHLSEQPGLESAPTWDAGRGLTCYAAVPVHQMLRRMLEVSWPR